MDKIMTTRKFTTLEKRAIESLKPIRDGEYTTYHFEVRWVRSQQWGYNPSITTREGKAAHASGCGYDKLSAVLADFLRFLYKPGTDEYRAICAKNSAGLSAVQDQLKELGWNLEQTFNGQVEDGFKLSRIN